MSERVLRERLVAVSNTGPLISAFQCGGVGLLKRYFSVIHVTGSVVTEIENHGWAGDIRGLAKDRFVTVVGKLTEAERRFAERVARRIAEDKASGDANWQVHLPEAEAMAVMTHRTQLAPDVLLIDEKAARNVAQKEGLRILGFPGVLGRAGLDGLLTQGAIRRLLEMCRQQGTRYDDDLIQTVARTYGSRGQ